MPKLVGINHVALEVGDIDEALEWYGKIFDLELRGRMGNAMAFVDMGDQFIALSRGRAQPPDLQRHFGLVVDDKEAVRERLVAEGVPVSAPPGLDVPRPVGQPRCRSSTTARFSSRRRRRSCARWASSSRRARRPWQSCATRAFSPSMSPLEGSKVKWPNWLGLVVDDLEAQRRFYRDTIGLTELGSGDGWVQFDLGFPNLFELLQRSDEPQYDRRRFQPGFAVDDIRAARERLLERGVEPVTEIEGEADSQGNWCYFRDPEGNTFELSQRLGEDWKP